MKQFLFNSIRRRPRFAPGLLISAIGALALAVGATGCFQKNSDAIIASKRKLAATASVTAAGVLGTYQATFYAFVRNNCSACHSGIQVPFFAGADVKAAYEITKNPAYINFSSWRSSLFAIKADDGHCGVASCSGYKNAMLQALQPWCEAEVAAGNVEEGPPRVPLPQATIFTDAQPVPAAVVNGDASATGANYVPMRWNLSSLQPAFAAGSNAVFEVGIQKLGQNYKIRNPRIVGLTSASTVQGIHVYVKRATDTDRGYEQLQATDWTFDNVFAAAVARPNPLPAATLNVGTVLDADAMLLSPLSGTDYITIGFDALTAGAVAPPTFAQIQTLIITPKCIGCHGAGAGNGVDLSTLAAVRNRLVLSPTPNAGASQLYIAVGPTGAMPRGGAKISAADLATLAAWINAGAPQ